MNVNLRTHAQHRAVPCHVILGVIATSALLALPASARTVYDAGKALRQNFTENATPANPYTDENGGKWYYSSAAGVAPYTSLGNFASSYAKIDNDQLQGWGGTASPHLKVNITGHTLTSSSFMTAGCEPIEADEMMFHPGGSGNSYMVLRFVVPEAGWYSAFASFHDTSKQSPMDASSGASVYVGVGANDTYASGIVSIEGATNSTRRFDFQMPVRFLAKDTEIRFTVGNNKSGSASNPHTSDATGVKVFVVKEDEGAFYDSGIAMTDNLATSYSNPYGNIKGGTWYFLKTSVPSSSVDFVSWAPNNFMTNTAERISTKGTRSSGGLKGFGRDSSANSPYVVVNSGTSVADNTAPGELQAHPYGSDARVWTTIRFRPPVSGYYSASVVARNLAKGNGVDAYLLVSGNVVTNARVSLANFAATARLTFDARLIVAGEPVDIVISPNTAPANDATGVSAIFRREEGDVYDAGKSFYADRADGGTTNSFHDLLGGATWKLGAKTNAWCGAQFYEGLTTFSVASGSKTKWWMQGRFGSWDEYPYFLMITNGVASIDSSFDMNADLFAVAPYEFAVRPNDPGYQSSSPTVKATVPADGIYRVRSCVRDLNNGGGDGVRGSVVANGYVVDSAVVWRLASGGGLYETILSADRLWLKAGNRIEYVVDPQETRNEDPTGLTACYEIEDASPSAHVINIDVTGSSGNGRFSSTTATAREGWGDWTRWNAIRFSSSLPQTSSRTIENCREADGTTKGNVSFTITRDSGATIQKGSGNGPTGLHNIWVASESASDTYTLTLSKLKANEPYTLWLYSAKATAGGNATFTVGGVTKGVEEPWSLGATNMVTRFDATSDANGQITGTFAAADSDGGAFNGLTIVGEFPDYVPEAFVLTFR